MIENALDGSGTAQTEDTIVARSTPPGRSIRAIVRLSGPETERLVRGVVRDEDRDWIEEHRFGARDVNVRIEEPRAISVPGTLFLMREPRSYTGEDSAEVHIPGSIPVIELLIEQMQARGARVAEPGEFTERAFLNGRLDLAQAEAVLSLIEARDEEERQMALGQLEGKLSEKVDDLRERLTHLCAYVESALDFADQDIDVIDREGIRSFLEPILSRVNEIIRTGREQKPVQEDVIGAFYGRPNVGKSSLFNVLIQEDRSIVTEIAGTTRDVIEGTLVIDGHPVRLLDTAGVEDMDDDSLRDELEKKMTERARRAVSRAHLVLHVEEARRVLANGSFPDPAFGERDVDRLKIVSKMDELDEYERNQLTTILTDNSCEGEFHLTSAENNTGIKQLIGAIREQLLTSGMDGGAFRLNVRHLESLKQARNYLERGLQAVDDGRPYELIAVDLRDALDALGEIVGEVGIEDILGVIFSEFCIGK